MEWSFDIKSIFFIEFTLSWFTLPLINVDYIPLLMDLSSLLLVTLDMSSFGISSSLNIKVFLLIEALDVFTFKSEHLPPS
jgi:hypothetical protein